VYPGVEGWRAVLRANQQNLAESLAVRPEFRAYRRGTGDDSVKADKQAWARDYNAAYVLLHYFGYLKRDVDADAEGYEFWLNNLNRTGDYRGLTRAFIESEEYKRQTR
jgi:hypothetical protein